MLEVIIGLLGGVLVQHFYGQYKLKSEQSQLLITKYLIFLQDASESLYLRIENINKKGGKILMDDEYFAISTLYSISKVLAVDLLLLRDGIYANRLVDQNLVREIRSITSVIHNEFDRNVFLRYHRIELAEACILNNGLSGWHDFRIRVAGSDYQNSIDSYKLFLEKHPKIETEILTKKLNHLIKLLESITDVPSSIK